MTDTRLIARAAEALREAHSGQREGSGFTRARVLATLEKRKRRRRRWVISLPLGALLLAGSAWAQGTGQWPRLWHAMAAVFVPSPALGSRGPGEPSAPPGAPPPRAVSSDTPSTAPAAVPASSSGAAPTEPAGVRRKATSARRAVAPRASEPEPPPPDPELSLFRRAYDLHFAGAEPRAAIQAFAGYLAAYPEGRFVPEARYNTALDWLKLGDQARARQLLEPFAGGAYDGYRRDEAARLLEALH